MSFSCFPWHRPSVVPLVLASFMSVGPGRAQTVTTRASVALDGHQVKNAGLRLSTRSIGADGRYVAFTSDAPDLVPDDTNGF